jgi:hypothetical protein
MQNILYLAYGDTWLMLLVPVVVVVVVAGCRGTWSVVELKQS